MEVVAAALRKARQADASHRVGRAPRRCGALCRQRRNAPRGGQACRLPSRGSRRCAARTIGRTRRWHGARRVRFGVDERCDPRRDEDLSGPGAPHGDRRPSAGSVLFVNDSKATNADAAAKALATFEPIYWIAGGQAKAGGIEPLARLLPENRQGLSDRRGRRRLLRRRSPARCRMSLPATSQTAVALAAEDAALDLPSRAGGAAFARLRLLRPVRRFRGARRGVPSRLSRRWITRRWRTSHDQPRASLADSRTGGGPSTAPWSAWSCCCCLPASCCPSPRAHPSPSGLGLTASTSCSATRSTRRSRPRS